MLGGLEQHGFISRITIKSSEIQLDSPVNINIIQINNFGEHQNIHPNEAQSKWVSRKAAINHEDSLTSKPLTSCTLPSCTREEKNPSPKFKWAKSLLKKHRLPIPEHLTLEVADEIIDTLKHAQVSPGPRSP